MNTLENSIHQFFGIEKIEDSLLVARLFKKETLAKNGFFLQEDKNLFYNIDYDGFLQEQLKKI